MLQGKVKWAEKDDIKPETEEMLSQELMVMWEMWTHIDSIKQ